MVDFLLPPSGSRRGTIPTATLVDALAGELGGGNIFIFRPGGEAGGNVYTSWALLHAALAAVQGPRVVFIDAAATAIIPSGTWDCTQTTFLGAVPRVTTLQLQGAVVAPEAFVGLDLQCDGDGVVPLQLVGGTCTLEDCRLWNEDAAIPAIRLDGALPDDAITLRLRRTSLEVVGAGPLIATTGTNKVLQLIEGSVVDGEGSVSGDGTLAVDFTGLDSNFTTPQTFFGGTLTFDSSFTFDRAHAVLEATGRPRFGPWRSTAEGVSPGLSYDAQDRERVLLSGSMLPGETFTVNVPTAGGDDAPEGSTFTVKNVNATGSIALALIVNTGDGSIEDVGTRGSLDVSAAFDLPTGGYVTWEKQGGTWLIVAEGALA